jgi:hypothetical protein
VIESGACSDEANYSSVGLAKIVAYVPYVSECSATKGQQQAPLHVVAFEEKLVSLRRNNGRAPARAFMKRDSLRTPPR